MSSSTGFKALAVSYMHAVLKKNMNEETVF